jgi:molecular chaperone HtpG
MAKETFSFQAEVSKLLDIVAHSLYSQKEIFLRELVSNASDACDRLRYDALTKPELSEGDTDFRIVISADKKKKTLTIADNGCGMSHAELTENLGTIARSGTRAFMDQLARADKDKSGKNAAGAMSPIGQFGVGFYSAFMVADKVEVLTRKAGSDKAYLWISDGKGEFTIDESERDGRGATITLHLAKDAAEYLEKTRIETIIKSYSDHIGIPIVFKDGDGERTLNDASALWALDKKEITKDRYKEFYHHVAHAFDDPWLTLHNRVEGMMSYINLLFIPSMPPFDLFQPERKGHVKLYVNRVFITDDCEGLLPPYLRFLCGVVDSQDLPLNISREMLQHDPRLAKIRSGLVRKVLGELKKKAAKKPDDYAVFWQNFGAVFKEGIYEDQANREKILDLARFRGTNSDNLISLDDYVGRMKDGQQSIFYISGETPEQVAVSPQLEGFRARGLEVLLLADPIDDFWIPAVGAYKEKPFKSVTQGAADLDAVAPDEDKEKDKGAGKDKNKSKDKKKNAAGMDALIAAFKLALGKEVKDVAISGRLTSSPVCLVAGEGDMDMHLERMLKQHQQLAAGMASSRVLEINPDHSLIRHLAALAGKEAAGKHTDKLADAAHLLLDQARIAEGEPVADIQGFTRRMAAVMEKGF